MAIRSKATVSLHVEIRLQLGISSFKSKDFDEQLLEHFSNLAGGLVLQLLSDFL